MATEAGLRGYTWLPVGNTAGMATCECQTGRCHLALVEDAVEAVREAVRLCPEDERLREERQLLDLQIEERLAVSRPN